MSEEKTSKISPKAANNVKAFFLILVSFVLIINVGPIARTFAFPLIYFFGIGSYLLLLLPLDRGIYRLSTGHKKTHVSPFTIVGLVLVFVSIEFFVTKQFVFNHDLNQAIDLYNGQLSHYYSDKIINMFDSSSYWSNGLIFITITNSLKTYGAVIAVGVVSLVFGLILIAFPYFSKAIKNRRESKKSLKENESNIAQERSLENEVISEEETPVLEETYVENEVDQTLNIEKEPAIVNYGFEPESFDTTSDDYLRESVSLDDQFEGNKLENEEFSEFKRLKFHPTPVTENITSRAHSYTEEFEANKPQNNYEEVSENNDTQEDSFNNDYDEIENNEIEIEETPTEEITNNEESITQVPSFENKVEEPVIPAPTPEVKVRKPIVWVSPSSDLLNVYETEEAQQANISIANERVEIINQAFVDLKAGAHVESFTIGPSVTRYNIVYDPNSVSRNIDRIVDDVSIRLRGVTARFVPIVSGETYSGLEVPNAQITTVGFKEIYDQLPDVKSHPLAVAFGKDISGNVVSADFDEFPHLLVAGTTGSGKSIYIHSIICTLIMRMSPEELRIALVDPKKVEMTKYREMPHLLCPIISEASKAKVMLDKLAVEMNDRYSKFVEADDASNIKQYNEWAVENKKPKMPYIIVVLDEYADLVDNCKEISSPVVQIAQKARAAGIHLLISTQRPSTNVITGVIKGNLPTHVALMTSSYTDSMTILGEGGAEKLLGKGDMLVQSPLVSRVGVTRLQGCFIQNKEIVRVVGYLREHYETIYDENYLDLEDHSKIAAANAINSGEVIKEADAAEEEKYQSIKELVQTQEFISISKIQREYGVGFNRAGRFFLRLQREGIVSTEQDGTTKGCRVLVKDKFND